MKKVLLVVPDGSDEMEVAPFVEIPGWTKVVPDTERVEVTIAGWHDRIRMFHGMTMLPDVDVTQVSMDDYDALCLPGGWPGTDYLEQSQSETMLNLIARAHGNHKLIATMCTGIFALGEAGLLEGVKATSFAGDCCDMCRETKAKLIAYGADFQDKALVVDGNIISDIGPAVGDEVALTMMEILIGKDHVRKIVENMMYTKVTQPELRWTGPGSELYGEGAEDGACCAEEPVAEEAVLCV